MGPRLELSTPSAFTSANVVNQNVRTRDAKLYGQHRRHSDVLWRECELQVFACGNRNTTLFRGHARHAHTRSVFPRIDQTFLCPLRGVDLRAVQKNAGTNSIVFRSLQRKTQISTPCTVFV